MRDRDLYTARYLGFNWEKHRNWDYEDYLVQARGRFDWTGPVAIYPEQKTPRIRAQHGLFTIFGRDTRPLESQLPSVVRKIEIPFDAVPAAREFLDDAGINAATVFGDLDGFADSLIAHYGIR